MHVTMFIPMELNSWFCHGCQFLPCIVNLPIEYDLLFLLDVRIRCLNTLFEDFRLRRQLVFKARYKLNCSLIAGDMARSTLISVINHNFLQVEEICQKGNSIRWPYLIAGTIISHFCFHASLRYDNRCLTILMF